MCRFFKQDKYIILLITAVFLFITPFFLLKQGLMLIDTGREFYIPWQMLKGAVLYKDIFNLYGPFAYQLNALLFAIFGVKISVIYFAGLVNSLLIVIGVFLLSKEFLSKSISFAAALIIMFSLAFNTFLYNSNISYTYSIAYALCAFIFSLLFLIKYIKNGNFKFAYLSSLLAGLSLANKYEFSIFPLILLYVFIFIKPLGIKNLLKAFSLFIIFPVICWGILFLQGLTLSDIKNHLELINNLIHAPLLKLFFNKFGVFFNLPSIINLTVNSGFSAVFGFLPIINFALFLIFIKKIYNDKPLFIFGLSAISAGAKTFFFLNINHMGAFILPICFIFTIILLMKFNSVKKIMPVLLCVFILYFAGEDFSSLQYKNFEIQTNKGKIYTYKKEGLLIKSAYDYIIKNTSTEDYIAVLPEGCFINFLTERNGHNKYFNLSPLFYNDVFKENNVISSYKNSLPECFIILPIDNIEYGKSFFGIDYAQNFYEMIKDNYIEVPNTGNIKIYRKITK